MIPTYQTVQAPSGPVRVVRFDSMAEMAAHADACVLPNQKAMIEHSKAWFGVASWDEAMHHAIHGTKDAGADVAKLLEKMPPMPDTVGRRWRPEVAGQHPDVGRFIAGLPDAMRARRYVADEHNPLRIVVDPGSSSEVGLDLLKRRGAAILAVATALAAARPVTLTIAKITAVTQAHRAGAVIYELGVSPLDLTLAAAALQSQGVTRALIYRTVMRLWDCRADGDSMPFSFGITPDGSGSMERKSIANMRAIVGIPDDEEALILPTAYGRHPSISNPEKWVFDMLALYAPGGALEAA